MVAVTLAGGVPLLVKKKPLTDAVVSVQPAPLCRSCQAGAVGILRNSTNGYAWYKAVVHKAESLAMYPLGVVTLCKGQLRLLNKQTPPPLPSK